MNLLKKLFDHEYKELNKFDALADKVIELDEEMQKLSDEKTFVLLENDLPDIFNEGK